MIGDHRVPLLTDHTHWVPFEDCGAEVDLVAGAVSAGCGRGAVFVVVSGAGFARLVASRFGAELAAARHDIRS